MTLVVNSLHVSSFTMFPPGSAHIAHKVTLRLNPTTYLAAVTAGTELIISTQNTDFQGRLF